MKIDLVNFDETFLALSWTWTNDEEIRKLIDGSVITKEEQERWFNNLKNRSDYKVFGIEFDGKPIGVAGLKRIVDQTAHVFWYIGEKNLHGKGLGTMIAKGITEKAKQLKIKTLFGEPKVFNFRSTNLLFKEGYKIIDYYEETSLFLMKKEL